MAKPLNRKPRKRPSLTLHDKLDIVIRRIEVMATDITALSAELDQVKSDVSAAAARVQADFAALQAQIAALTAGTITQAQIDALTTAASDLDTSVNAIDPAATPAP